MVTIAEGADAVVIGVIGMIENVANLLTAMTRGTAVGMDEVHDEILHYRPGSTTDATATGDVIAGATIDFVTRVGGRATIRTTIGAIGPRTGGVIDKTVAIDLRGVLKIGIAGNKLSQSRDTIPVPIQRVSSNFCFLDTL